VIHRKEKDGSVAPESMIARYTPTASEYGEARAFTSQGGVGKPGLSREVAAAIKHRVPVTPKCEEIVR
jgi:hypothetical protein